MGTVPLAAEKRVEASARGATAKRLLTMYARLAIAAGFWSSVADRFGLWGPAGFAKMAWGEWEELVADKGGVDFFFSRSGAREFVVRGVVCRGRPWVLMCLGGWAA